MSDFDIASAQPIQAASSFDIDSAQPIQASGDFDLDSAKPTNLQNANTTDTDTILAQHASRGDRPLPGLYGGNLVKPATQEQKDAFESRNKEIAEQPETLVTSGKQPQWGIDYGPKSVGEAMTSPMFQEIPKATVNKDDNVVEVGAKAIWNNVAGLSDFAQSPVAAGLGVLGSAAEGVGVVGKIAKVALKGASAKFAVDLLGNAIEQGKVANDDTKTPAERVSAGVNSLLALFMGRMAAKHTLSSMPETKIDVEPTSQDIVSKVSTPSLQIIADNPEIAQHMPDGIALVNAELAKRQAADLQNANLPETAKVVSQPEAPTVDASKPSETTSSPIELSQRAKMISKALQNRGVAPEVADHFANKADGSNPEMPTEDFRQAAFDAFEKAGGKFPKEEGNRNVDVEAIKGQVNPETGENFTQEEAEAEAAEAQRRNQEDQDNAHQQNKELINENQPKSNSEVETDGTQTEGNDNKGQPTENGNSSGDSQHPVESETNRGNGDQLPSGTQTDQEVDLQNANTTEGARQFSLKNAIIDEQRVARGEEPIMAPERQSDPVTWDKAGREIENDPAKGSRLIEELNNKPRPISAVEGAILLHEMGAEHNNFHQIHAEIDKTTDPVELAKLNDRLETSRNRLDSIEQAARKAGTEGGRALAFRRRLMKEDFSLAAMETRARAKIGRALTPEESTFVKEQATKIAEADKKIAESDTSKRLSELEAALNKLKADLVEKTKTEKQERVRESRRGTAPVTAKVSDRLVSGLRSQRDAAWKRISERRQKTFADPLGIQILATMGDHAIIGASHIAELGIKGAVSFKDWSKSVAKDLGEIPDDVMRKLWTASKDVFTEQRLQDANSKQAILDSIGNDVRASDIHNLAKTYDAEKITDVNELVAKLKNDLKEVKPDITDKEIRDKFSNYGKKVELSRDEANVRKRDLQRQGRIVSGIEDIQKGQKPAKGGFETEQDSPKVAALKDEYQQELAKAGLSHDYNKENIAKEKELQNAIKDLDDKIAGKSKESNKQITVDTSKIAELKAEKDQKQSQLAEIQKANREAARPSEDVRKEQALQRRLDKIKADIAEEKEPLNSKKYTAKTEEQTRLEAEIKALRAKPVEQIEAEKLDRYKRKLEKDTQEINERTANNDFSRKSQTERVVDPETRKLQVEKQKAIDDYNAKLHSLELQKRGLYEKGMEGISKWARFAVLTSPKILAKLTSAAGEIIAITPVEEAVGGGISKLLPKVAEGAPRRGGADMSAIAKGIAETWKNLGKDFAGEMRDGKMDIDRLYGSKYTELPPDFKDYVGRLHGALKTPARRNEFTISFEKRLKWAAEHGEDITEPLVQMKHGLDAYKDANKSIFTEDNALSSAYQSLLKRFIRKDTEGNVSKTGKAMETALRVSLPVVKIPTNIFFRTLEYSFGTITGGTKLVSALHQGLENVSPAEKDAILQNLTRGTIGLAFMSLGFFNPNSVGGLYTPGDKRKKGEVSEGGLRIAGIDIPKYLVHNPLLEQMQIGATIRRLADKQIKGVKIGVPSAALATYLGVAKQLPFADQIVRKAELFQSRNPKQAINKVIGETVNTFNPQVLQWTAKEMDQQYQGHPPKNLIELVNSDTIKRKPETVLDYVKAGTPGLRQSVPKSKNQ